MVLLGLTLVIQYYSLKQLMIAWIPVLITGIILQAIISNGLVSSVIIAIIAYDLHLRINQINQMLRQLSKQSKPDSLEIYKTVKKYIAQHNRICLKVRNLSNFWRNFCLVMISTTFPITLIMLHLVLFERTNPILKVLYSLALLSAYLALFVMQYFLASFSAKMHKMSKVLSRLQWCLNGRQFPIGFKIKVMTYFERISHKKRRIGFAIGTLTIITFPMFAGVLKKQINMLTFFKINFFLL